ncbi:efflux transporter outer membrane subunit [Chitinophaga sp.]|uniref:efflux transporter outer membrane subunit n=1 Tax=Chitinophaga sp. TaxID=1869181 RepID=UPI0031D8BF68
MKRTNNEILIGLALAGALASCRVTKNYKPDSIQTAHLYRDTTGTGSTNLADLPWQQLFPDTELQALISEGLKNNFDLKTALQRILESEATLKQSKSAFLPTLSAGVDVTKSQLSQAAQAFYFSGMKLNTTTYRAQVNASWEIDIWGKLKSSKKMALANVLKSEAAARAVQTQLIADIANNYYTLLALDKQLAITKQTLTNRISDAETMKTLKENAVVNGAAVVQSEANRYAAEVAIPDLEQSILETENALSILLGRAPGAVSRTSLDSQEMKVDLKTGLSSDLLKNRPDVQEAQYAFMSAFENTNLARTYFYPSFAITAGGGISSIALEDMFKKSLFYSIAGALTQPILNQGQNKARLRTAQAQQQEALNTFQQTLLTASKEVSNAMSSYSVACRKQHSREMQISYLEKSVDFTKDLLTYSSSTNFTDVLTSEQNLLSAQLSGVEDKLQQLQAVVNLYRALGGGWK